MSDTGIIEIHGKSYKTVARRVADFRANEAYSGWAIRTNHAVDGDYIVCSARILNTEGVVISEGTAEERRGSTSINRTSALENCETSAVGRALAFLHGDLAGTEIASADEIAGALAEQVQLDEQAIRKDEWKRFTEFMSVYLDNRDNVDAIRDGLAIYHETALPISERSAALDIARESWFELGEDVQRTLWRATSKGGVFTTKERETMKTTEWREGLE